MTELRRMCVALAALVALALPHYVQGQEDFMVYRGQLLRMAEILGGVHHLRGSCDQSEDQAWRERMLRLIEIEQPSQQLRDQMIERFNATYEAQKRRFPNCDNSSAQEAARLAREGQNLALQMARQFDN